MAQKYSKRQSMPRNSLINTEKIIVQNIKSVVKQNTFKESIEWFPKFTKKWDKYVYTLCILFCYLYYGLCGSLFAPSMVDMKFLFRTTMADINYCNSFVSIGYLTGSLFGFLYKYINRQLSFIFNTILIGVFTALYPLCTSLWQLYLACFLSSVGAGAFDSGNSVWVVEMWKQNSAPVFQLSQMMYGVGSIIGPLFVKSYIYGELFNETDETIDTITTTDLTTLPTIMSTSPLMDSPSDDEINYSVDRRSNLIIPYLCSGLITLTVPIVLLVMFFVKRYKIPENRLLENKSNEAIGGPTDKHLEVSPLTRKILIALVALSLNSYSGFEVTYFNYSSTYYQFLPVHLSAPTAALVLAMMSITYTAGRGVSAFISSKVRAEIMLLYHIIIIILSLVVLHFGQHSLKFIYIGNAMIGFGFSAMWPSYFALSERYIKLTDKVTSIYSFISSLFLLTTPFLLGHLIEKKPEVFLIIEIGLFCTVVILFMIILFIVRRSQKFPFAYTLNN